MAGTGRPDCMSYANFADEREFEATPTPPCFLGRLASQARHESVAPEVTFASRNVVPKLAQTAPRADVGRGRGVVGWANPLPIGSGSGHLQSAPPSVPPGAGLRKTGRLPLRQPKADSNVKEQEEGRSGPAVQPPGAYALPSAHGPKHGDYNAGFIGFCQGVFAGSVWWSWIWWKGPRDKAEF
jgi:hypothetical protein